MAKPGAKTREIDYLHVLMLCPDQPQCIPIPQDNIPAESMVYTAGFILALWTAWPIRLETKVLY